MKVKDLIALLQTKDQDLPVAYACYSENCMLEEDDLIEQELCEERPDGWVANKRPDKKTITYLVFPGN